MIPALRVASLDDGVATLDFGVQTRDDGVESLRFGVAILRSSIATSKSSCATPALGGKSSLLSFTTLDRKFVILEKCGA